MLNTESERKWFLMGLVVRGRINSMELPEGESLALVNGISSRMVDDKTVIRGIDNSSGVINITSISK